MTRANAGHFEPHAQRSVLRMNETLLNVLLIPCGLFMFFLGRAQLRELTKVPKESQSKPIWQNQKLMGYGLMACGIFSMLVGAAKTIVR